MTGRYDEVAPRAVARSRDEARLFLDLTPCPDCGTVSPDWNHSIEDAGGELVSSYAAVCPGCGAEREYLFGLPERETAGEFPAFGGPEPSELLDPGQWLHVADLFASDVPEDDPGLALAIARAAVDEVVKFVPPGLDAVPPDAFWTEDGRRVHDAEPGRFRLDRLLLVRDIYRDTELE